MGNPFHMQDCNASHLEECKQHSVHLDDTVPINGWVGSQAAARHVFSAVQLRLRQSISISISVSCNNHQADLVSGLLGLKTLVVKMFSVTLSMAGGLIAGKEGPFIHAGGIVGGGWASMGSR